MPVVPVSEPRVQAAPFKPVYQSSEGATPDVFGAGQARAMQEFGKNLQQLGHEGLAFATKEQIEDNEREAKRLDTAYQTELLRLGMGDKDNPGYYTTQGENAIAGYEAHGKAMEEARRNVTKNVTNQRVLQAFSAQADQRDLQESRTKEAHLIRQREVANDAVYQGRVDASRQEMASFPNDPLRVNNALAVIRGEASSYADRKGLVGEAKEAEIRKQQGAGVEGAIKTALANQDQYSANALFSEHFNKLDPQQRATLANAIRENGIDERAQRLSDEVRRLGLSPAEARAYIEKNAPLGKERTKALEVFNSAVGAAHSDEAYAATVASRAWAELQRVEAIAAREKKKAVDEAEKFIYGALAEGKSVMQIKKERPDAFAVISEQLPKMLQTETLVANGTNYATTSDGSALLEISKLPRAELAQVDLNQYRTRLTRPQFEEATRKIVAAQNAMKATSENQGIYDTARKQVFDYAPKKIINGTTKTTLTDDQLNAAQNEMDAFVSRYTEQGKLPTRVEINKEAQRLMLQVKGDTNWWLGIGGFEGVVGEISRMTPEQRATLTISMDELKKAPDLLSEIRAEFKARGKTPTDAQIEQAAGAFMARDRNRALKIIEGK